MEYGKFKTAEELYKGYGELEKSFTRKCQQLAELEKQLSESGTSADAPPQKEVLRPDNDAVPLQETDGIASVGATGLETDGGGQHPETEKDVGLSESGKLPPAVITGGGNVSLALPNRPKTLAEASALAKELFK